MFTFRFCIYISDNKITNWLFHKQLIINQFVRIREKNSRFYMFYFVFFLFLFVRFFIWYFPFVLLLTYICVEFSFSVITYMWIFSFLYITYSSFFPLTSTFFPYMLLFVCITSDGIFLIILSQSSVGYFLKMCDVPSYIKLMILHK